MRHRLVSIPWNSIPVKLVLGLLGITIPLIGLLFYNNRYSVNVIHNQVAASNKNLISIYMKQIDTQLTEAERHLTVLATTDLNVQTMGEPASEDYYVLAKSAVYRKLTLDLTVYPYVDGFYVYSMTRDDSVEAYQGTIPFAELNGIRQAMKADVKELSRQSQYENLLWRVRRMNGSSYLVRLIRDNNLYVAAWVKASTVVGPLRDMQTGDTGAVLLVDDQGRTLYGTRDLSEAGLDLTRGFSDYYLSGRNNEYLVVGESSSKGGFSLTAAIPDRTILENLPYLAKASTIVTIIALLMLPLSFLVLRQVLLLPLRRMVGAMRLIGEGNFSLRIEPMPAPDEILLVNRTFNAMISRIEELKISVYEEQLSKQRAELKQLQLQINPHFFMNSLNILYNLAQVKQYGLIQEMTMNLVHYFRYMFQSRQPLALLRDELRHIRRYLRIQELRFPNTFAYEIRVPEYLETTAVPPLMLQTVVENTIKHAVASDTRTLLTVEAELDDLAEEPMVCITVRDTGEGFSDAALSDIREGRIPVDERGEHIGLWSIRERLKLQYGGKAWMECYNDDPQGAVTEIAVPLTANPDMKE